VRWGDVDGIGTTIHLGFMDPIPPTRWWIAGCSGSGKSTLASQLSTALNVPHHELDGIFHQPGWQPIEPEEFRRRVADVTAKDGWVIDGNYRQVFSAVFERVEVIVALDLPRRVVIRRIIRRTLRRAWTRQELWNGNRESWLNIFRWNPERSIIRWSWTSYPRVQERLRWIERLANERRIPFLRIQTDEPLEKLVEELLTRSSFVHQS